SRTPRPAAAGRSTRFEKGAATYSSATDAPVRRCAAAHAWRGSARTLRSELPQVMIEVQVAPAQPLGLGHRAERRVESALEGSLLGDERAEQSLELRAISLERGRRGATDERVDLGPGRNAVRPGERQPDGEPAAHNSGHEAPGAGHLPRA